MSVTLFPAATASALVEEWKVRVEVALRTTDWKKLYISSEECQKYARYAALLRSQILFSVYNDEYHTDVLDLQRLEEKIIRGEERVFFWGEAATIAAVREAFSRPDLLRENAVNTLPLGTSTLFHNLHQPFSNYVELGRTGSTCTKVASLIPNLLELLDLYDNGQARDHTFFCTPRNCPSKDGRKGGTAIHRIQAQSVGSSFWGFAPWYILEGGFLEVLDYREILPDAFHLPRDGEGPALFFDSEEAEVFSILWRTNFQRPAETDTVLNVDDGLRWAVYKSSPTELQAFQPLFIIPASGSGVCIEEALREAASQNAASVIVFVPLVSREAVSDQQKLGQRGFHFIAVQPAERVGMWCRPRAGCDFAVPYYSDSKRLSAPERKVIEYLRSVVRDWQSNAT